MADNLRQIHVDWREEDLASLQSGLDQLTNELKNKIVTDAIFKGADIVLEEAKQKVPIRTGGLRESLRRRRLNELDSIGARVLASTAVKPGGFHAHLVEFGHRVVVRKGRGLFEKGFYPARPFLRPALENNRTEIINLVAAQIAKRTAKQLKKQGGA